MRSISAEAVFSHLTPSTLVDFITSLPKFGETSAELYNMAYDALVRCVGTQEADAMIAEAELNNA